MTVRIRKSRALESLSLTPLIDVVFLLLIFFLVATRFAEEDRELDVKLPTASEAKPLMLKPKDIELSIDEAGNYYLGAGHGMSYTEVEAALANAAVNNPLSQTVVIRAHQGCRWNDVARVMNACYRAGLRDVKTSVAGGN
ncbi:MAG: biopolymer transporter ExbD [Planctomycetales bacterium]|nr:biopolymer transporter ExbD [Planctomycetales bacterium]MCA9167498.1 biopolymer transporter ExbD [Planctomycetales bacterium]